MKTIQKMALGALFALGATQANAQAFPARPITMIVPFAAGGPTDVVARIVGDHMSRTLGQPVIIENVAGAGGTTGITRAAKATPDGYTIAMGHMGTHGASPGLYPNLAYDPQKDFEPIGLAAGTPILIVTRKDFPAKDLKEFSAYVKANENKINHADAGPGAVSNVTCILLHDMLKVNPVTVPYKGTGPLLNDLMSGKVDYACDQIVNLTPQIKAGTIKAIAVATEKRAPALPDVPTTTEGGLPGYKVSAWNAAFAPKGTPPEALAKLREALVKAVTDPGTKAKLEELGGEVPDAKGASPEALAALVKSENERWVPLLKAKGNK
ncbi:MAG: tripartite tricarboxylate transporter substrate binding protein BugD [Proteobacteria bacterium]|nr:tripartite tricarboxylate transporter substrate binding protein BugD [Pseudomonadota bacterium]